MSTDWQEKDGVARCDARDPQSRQCVLASGHAGDHEPEPESSPGIDVPQVAASVDPTIPVGESRDRLPPLDDRHELPPDIPPDKRTAEESEKQRARLRGCFGSAALLVAVVVAIALTQRRR